MEENSEGQYVEFGYYRKLERELTAVTAERNALAKELERTRLLVNTRISERDLFLAELNALKATQMTEEKAREVLGVLLKGEEIDYESRNKEANWPFYCNGILIKSAAHLVGIFEPEQLNAIAWWMENKGEGR
jgi:hypothetical protein